MMVSPMPGPSPLTARTSGLSNSVRGVSHQLGLGGLGPVPEGLAAWLGGIGVLVGAAIWIAAHTTRTNKKKVDA